VEAEKVAYASTRELRKIREKIR